jgi:hypothetical protein
LKRFVVLNPGERSYFFHRFAFSLMALQVLPMKANAESIVKSSFSNYTFFTTIKLIFIFAI